MDAKVILYLKCTFTVRILSLLSNIKSPKMKKTIFTAILGLTVVALLASCGQSRKLGCPSVAGKAGVSQSAHS